MKAARPVARDGSLHVERPIVAAYHADDPATLPERPPVTHSYAALVFCTAGSSRVEQDGDWTLRAGDVLLVPAGAAHRMAARRSLRYWTAAFCVSCFAGDGAAADLLELFERVRDGASPVARIPAARRAYLGGLFGELEVVGQAASDRRTVLTAVERSLLTLILAEVGKAAASEAPPRRARSSVVVDALRFIERHCLRRLSLREVAAAVGRRPTYVTAAVAKATGRSVGQWVVTGRMAEARRLLLHSDEMIDVIAERVGYADARHFIRMFRREHGVTPAAWRAARTAALE
jgi:AraC-like DNA-binding protein